MNEPHWPRVVERSRFKRSAIMVLELLGLVLLGLAAFTLLAVLRAIQ